MQWWTLLLTVVGIAQLWNTLQQGLQAAPTPSFLRCPRCDPPGSFTRSTRLAARSWALRRQGPTWTAFLFLFLLSLHLVSLLASRLASCAVCRATRTLLLLHQHSTSPNTEWAITVPAYIYIYKVAQPLHQQAAALTFFVIPISEISVVVVWSVEETIKQAPRHGALPQALLGRPPRPPAARGHRYTTPPPALHYCYIHIL